MQPKVMMLISGVIMALGVGTGVMADDPTHPPAPTEGHGSLLSRLLQPIPSDTGHYIGYFVGGGNGRPHKAEQRHEDEGTWGWDYQGWIIKRRVVLGWWHGQKFQGGTGAYKTDGPHLYHEEGK
jgi:hypothetical protein